MTSQTSHLRAVFGTISIFHVIAEAGLEPYIGLGAILVDSPGEVGRDPDIVKGLGIKA